MRYDAIFAILFVREIVLLFYSFDILFKRGLNEPKTMTLVPLYFFYFICPVQRKTFLLGAEEEKDKGIKNGAMDFFCTLL